MEQMQQLNIDLYPSVIDDEKVVKKRKIKNLNKEPFSAYSFASAIDNKDLREIKKLCNKVNNNIKNKNNKIDIILELYKRNFLNSRRIKFIIEKCTNYMNISSYVIKILMQKNEVNILDIIFENFKIYDNDFILKLLFYYKNKTAVSVSCLNEQISNKFFNISVKSFNYCYNYTYYGIGKYLLNECNKENINIFIIKYLIEHGAKINIINIQSGYDETALIKAYSNGNKVVVKYLIKHGSDISKKDENGETILFKACSNGDKTLVKYLIEHGHGIDINKKILGVKFHYLKHLKMEMKP